MHRNSADIINLVSFESPRLHFENIEFAIAVLIE